MYKNKKIAAIIAAAGSGSRMGGSAPKQYLDICGKAMVVKTAGIFSKCSHIDCIIVVADAGHCEKCEELLQKNGINAIIAVGGERRQDSVYEGLKKLPLDTDYVLIHDAARPFAAVRLIEEALEAVLAKKAVVCAVPVKDTIRMMTGRERSVTTDRSLMYAVQTPQAFEKRLIVDSYEQAYREGFVGTDDAALAERAGYPVHIIAGSYDNIKITTRGDMPAATETRVGTGFDAHAFAAGRKLFLGGIEIPYEKGLAGHSDADVLLHAVMDALLGAAGCGDIGGHFPDSDERYKGISSLALLEKVAGIIKSKGYSVGNIDAVVIAERPKISGYRLEMSKTAAKALGVSEDKINIKGTTTENMGFIGRGEGIAAHAVCTLIKSGLV
ncbi:MAG: 2-C-methyl-D-erythritol 4-phosphate cytidylyltransferase [Clostridiales bacterium]|nr:2-C-methyl-D-erythritol 4-phosphate cytidylyltransferase [Clostridiales bacterium]